MKVTEVKLNHFATNEDAPDGPDTPDGPGRPEAA